MAHRVQSSAISKQTRLVSDSAPDGLETKPIPPAIRRELVRVVVSASVLAGVSAFRQTVCIAQAGAEDDHGRTGCDSGRGHRGLRKVLERAGGNDGDAELLQSERLPPVTRPVDNGETHLGSNPFRLWPARPGRYAGNRPRRQRSCRRQIRTVPRADRCALDTTGDPE